MERTRVVINVGVVFDVDRYEQAGQILDRIDSKLGKILDGVGQHEITGFQTRPCKAAKFDRAMMARPEPDGYATQAMEAPSFSSPGDPGF